MNPIKALQNYFKVMFGTKTGRTAALAIAATVGAYLNGTVNPQEAFVAIVAALQTVNIRDAIAKASNPKEPATGGGGTGGAN